MEKEINVNVTDFARQMSEIIGLTIRDEAVYPVSTGWYYYIQPPKSGAPMLLNSYKGGSMMIIVMSKEDYQAIENGSISPHEYIKTANWQVGFYWGGGSMITGGYYQPLDIINRQDEVRRYLRILMCRGFHRSCGYMPTEENCNNCKIENCPFSQVKKGGDWKLELQEPDPRIELFEALLKRFKAEHPGYGFKGFTCGENIPDNEIWLEANGIYTTGEEPTFRIAASEEIIRSLLMHEIEPKDWDSYASGFTFLTYSWKYKKDHVESKKEPVTEETLEAASKEKDYTKMEESKPSTVRPEPHKVKKTIGEKIGRFFRAI